MKTVKYYTGVPKWCSNNLTCQIAVRQQDGTLKDEIIVNVRGSDPWSGQITTEDTVYVWVPSEIRSRAPLPVDTGAECW